MAWGYASPFEYFCVSERAVADFADVGVCPGLLARGGIATCAEQARVPHLANVVDEVLRVPVGNVDADLVNGRCAKLAIECVTKISFFPPRECNARCPRKQQKPLSIRTTCSV